MVELDVIMNPRSGSGNAARRARQLATELEPLMDGVKLWRIDEWPGEAVGRDALVVGGDGTVRWALDKSAHLANRPRMAVFPSGTANLLARHLGGRWPRRGTAAAIARAVRSGRTRRLDLATVNGVPMLLMCGIGFDADVVHELDARRRGAISKLHYLPAIARTLWRFAGGDIAVRVDGREIYTGPRAAVIVANAREYGAGFSLAPLAQSDDGLLDVTVLPFPTRASALIAAGAAAVGRLEQAGAVFGRGTHVRVDGSARVQVDGDPLGTLPVDVRLPGTAQTFIVPGP